MIRLVASDLDDTLLNRDWEISAGNIQAIHRAVAQGTKFTLATGRMAVASRKYARQLGLDVPIITYHGALVEQALSGEVLYRKVIPIDLAVGIVEYLLKNKIHVQLFMKDRVFVAKANKLSETYGKMTGVVVEETDILPLLGKEPEGLEKILCILDGEAAVEKTEELRRTYAGRLHFTSSQAHFFDMTHPEVNKGQALQALADGWGIAREEVMAVGDSLNDKEMIRYAGIGVAMGNAHPEIKKIADYITSSNNEDGVAKALEKFVLQS